VRRRAASTRPGVAGDRAALGGGWGLAGGRRLRGRGGALVGRRGRGACVGGTRVGKTGGGTQVGRGTGGGGTHVGRGTGGGGTRVGAAPAAAPAPTWGAAEVHRRFQVFAFFEILVVFVLTGFARSRAGAAGIAAPLARNVHGTTLEARFRSLRRFSTRRRETPDRRRLRRSKNPVVQGPHRWRGCGLRQLGGGSPAS
jgi:hypothetical protein